MKKKLSCPAIGSRAAARACARWPWAVFYAEVYNTESLNIRSRPRQQLQLAGRRAHGRARARGG